jgi:dTDP-4-amino-4,6-dideoxygalactose transaminase
MILTDGEHSRSTLLEFRDYDKKALSPTKYNYKMTDLQASLGLNQLTGLPGFI